MTHLNCGCYEHHLCCRLNGLSGHFPAHVRGKHVAMPVQDVLGNELYVSGMSTSHGHFMSRQKDVEQIMCIVILEVADLMNSKQGTAKEGWLIMRVMMHMMPSGASFSSMSGYLNEAC